MGFDTVAKNSGLLLLPILLDLLLWLGPHLRIMDLLQPVITATTSLPGLDTPDMANIVSTNKTLWHFFAVHFNLLSTLRTYPIGVPSLVSGEYPIITPLGGAPIYEIKSAVTALGLWVILAIAGLVAGSLYFNWISHVVFQNAAPINLAQAIRATFQVVLLTLVCIIALVLLSIPLMIIIPLVYLISPGLAEFTLLITLLVIAWLLVPFLFSPHGIFAYQQNVFIAMWTSARLVRFTLPMTGLFVLIALLLSQGLNLVWQIPSENSWMMLVGIAGHSFIATGIVTASFIYYRDGMRWAQEIMQHNRVAPKTI